MLVGVGEVILAADDVTDAQIGVVHTRGEMIGRHSVRPQQGEVFDLVCELRLRAINAIHKSQSPSFAAGHPIAQRKRLAGGGAAVGLLAREIAHTGVAEPGALRRGLLFVGGAGGREVAIREPLGKDGFGGLAVQVQAFGLLVLFVPVEPQPSQPIENGADAGLGVPLHIGVVQAQHHGSVIVAGIKPVENERPSAADMKEPGGRRCKTNANASRF